MPQYPIVPPLPGVPALFRDASNSDLAVPAPLSADGISPSQSQPQGPQWGIFDQSGNAVITPDSYLSVEFRSEARVPTYPIELGSFGSYNKVDLPYEAKPIMTIGGSVSDRTSALTTLQALKEDVNLYVWTEPEFSYGNMNLIDYSYERTNEKGVQLISVQVHLQEIRPAPAPSFSNTTDPAASGQAQDGSVQPQTPTQGQLTASQAATANSQGVGTVTAAPAAQPAPGGQ